MKITHITLQTNNLQATLDFYTATLKLPILSQHANSITLQAGDTTLTFIAEEKKVEVYHFAFNIPSNQLSNALVWAKVHLNLIENYEGNLVTTFENWKSQSVYFTDNNGNLLEFIAREDIQVVVDEAFSPTQILTISEMGIVVEKPMVQAEKLIKKHNLVYFDKAEPTEQFLALGDDQGLLIMVTPNRNWFPTTIEAQPTVAQIEIQQDANIISIESTTLFKD